MSHLSPGPSQSPKLKLGLDVKMTSSLFVIQNLFISNKKHIYHPLPYITTLILGNLQLI
jgi:hypothetical protein